MGFAFQDQNGSFACVSEGRDIKEAFEYGAKGVFSFEYDIDQLNDGDRITVAIEAPNISTLFSSWLTELLIRKNAENLLLGDFRISSLQKVNDHQYVLTGEAFGESYDATRHQKKGEINQIESGTCDEGEQGTKCSCTITMK